MSTLLGVLGGVLGGGVLAAVVYYVRRALLNAVALDQRNAELAAERARVEAMEKAAAAQRAERQREFDERAGTVTTSEGAAELLREEFKRSATSPVAGTTPSSQG